LIIEFVGVASRHAVSLRQDGLSIYGVIVLAYPAYQAYF
jgi:hypothetical protein